MLFETYGWSSAEHNIQQGYCEVDESSITTSGCRISTYFYRRFSDFQWFPLNPNISTATLCYSVWGIKKDGAPDSPKVESGAEIGPKEFSMSCYPNPSNSSISFKFANTDNAPIELDIYNILGLKVKTDLIYPQNSHYHNYIWDGTNNYGCQVVSGVYYAKAAINDKSSTIKMVLIK